MESSQKVGSPWNNQELDAIVQDYFSMLEDDLAGRPYVKSKHSAELLTLISRSHRSVEFKHQNISAVLDELGLPWIPGYKPKSNYQNAIFDAIDRYLTLHPTVLEITPTLVPVDASPSEVFVSRPTIKAAEHEIPVRLRRLVSKFDPVQGVIEIAC